MSEFSPDDFGPMRVFGGYVQTGSTVGRIIKGCPIRIQRLPNEQEAAVEQTAASCHDSEIASRIRAEFPPAPIHQVYGSAKFTHAVSLDLGTESDRIVWPVASGVINLDMKLSPGAAKKLKRIWDPWHDSLWLGPWRLVGYRWHREHRICGLVVGPLVRVPQCTCGYLILGLKHLDGSLINECPECGRRLDE